MEGLRIQEKQADGFLYDLVVSSAVNIEGTVQYSSGDPSIGKTLATDSAGNATWEFNDGYVPNPEDWENSYSQDAVTRYVHRLSQNRKYQPAYSLKSLDASAVTGISAAYNGAVFSPTENRVYFVPFGISNSADWHYIDCSDGSIVEYAHGVGSIGLLAYTGGVYSPIQNRIYFVPYNISNTADWHYVDCDTGTVTAYTHGFGTSIVNDAYAGGVYSPTENRVYLVPFAISNVAEWHYIDCSDGSVVAYTHGYGTSITTGAFLGGGYSPAENRVYLVPYGISDESEWYYIDCSDNTAGNAAVVSYTHGFGTSIANNAMNSAVYSPTENRLYLLPFTVSSDWYYIDCSDNTAGNAAVVAYEHGQSITSTINGGVFSPTENRVYLVPYGNSDESEWYYIDCSNNTAGNAAVVGYEHGETITDFGFNKAAYSPTEDRIYFAPYNTGSQSTWYALGQKYANSGETALTELTAGAMFCYN